MTQLQRCEPVAERVEVRVDLDPYLTLDKLSEYSGLGKSTLRYYINRPRSEALPCYRFGSRVMVRVSEFDAWAARFRTRGLPNVERALAEIGLTA